MEEKQHSCQPERSWKTQAASSPNDFCRRLGCRSHNRLLTGSLTDQGKSSFPKGPNPKVLKAP